MSRLVARHRALCCARAVPDRHRLPTVRLPARRLPAGGACRSLWREQRDDRARGMPRSGGWHRVPRYPERQGRHQRGPGGSDSKRSGDRCLDDRGHAADRDSHSLRHRHAEADANRHHAGPGTCFAAARQWVRGWKRWRGGLPAGARGGPAGCGWPATGRCGNARTAGDAGVYAHAFIDTACGEPNAFATCERLPGEHADASLDGDAASTAAGMAGS